jgi:hypothetical protein
MVEPMPQLKKMYEDGVLKDGGQDNQSHILDDDTTIDD